MIAFLDNAITACNHALWDGADVAGACRTLSNVLQALGRFEEAMDWHTKALQAPTNRADLFASLGKLYAQQQAWTEAIAAYQQALSLQPDHSGAYWSLANIYLQQGERAKELECRWQALRLKPSWATPQHYLHLGNVLMASKRLEDATTCYRLALQVKPNFLEAQHNLAVVLAQRGAVAEAIAQYRQTLETHPDHSESYFGLGKLFAQQRNELEAIAAYRRAVELKPDYASALYALGELLLQHEIWEEGAAIYRQTIELNPQFSWSYHYLGYALLKQRRYYDAALALRQAIDLNPDFAWTHYHLTHALFRQQRWDETVAAALAAIRCQPDLNGIYTLLGQAVHQRLQSGSELGREDCIAQYQSHPPISLETGLPQFYQHVALALQKYRQFEGAAVFYQLALPQHPEPDQIKVELAQVRQQQQQRQHTIATLRQRIQQQPQLPWSYSQLANLLAEQGEVTDAILLNQKVNLLQGWHQAEQKQYEFTQDWFTHHISTWRKHLGAIAHASGLNVLEIGSFEGRSTCWLLDFVLTDANSRITCIDLYFQERFDFNIHRSGASQKVIKLQGNSLKLLPTLKPQSYDLIYIDGCHLVDHVQRDAAHAWKLLKPGGIIIFDDYEYQDPLHPGHDPKPGIDRFLITVQPEIHIFHRAYQIIAQKISR
ncbi:MAG: hypothetical protein Kow00121_11320 [Elainellaceae cyanobacterium]